MNTTPENEISDEAEGRNPFQFSILHLIYLTVGVAALCVLDRLAATRDISELIGVYLTLDGIFVIIFVRCIFIGRNLSRKQWKTTLLIFLAVAPIHAFLFLVSGPDSPAAAYCFPFSLFNLGIILHFFFDITSIRFGGYPYIETSFALKSLFVLLPFIQFYMYIFITLQIINRSMSYFAIPGMVLLHTVALFAAEKMVWTLWN